MDDDQIEYYQREIQYQLKMQEENSEPAEPWDGEEPTDYDRGFWAGYEDGEKTAWNAAMELFKKSLEKRGLLEKYNWDYVLYGDRDKFIRNYIGSSDYSDDTETDPIE